MKKTTLLLLIILTVWILSGCSQAPAQEERSFDVYYIAIDNNGARWPAVGCNDSAVEMTKTVFEPYLAPEDAIRALLTTDESVYQPFGLYNVFENSELALDQVIMSWNTALTYLSWQLLIWWICDTPRVEAQLYYTTTQFDNIDDALFFINDEPLADILNQAD
jgi:hypothetical protein